MEINDLKLLSKLIKIYGIKDIEYAVELNKIFLSYMNKEEVDNPTEVRPMYCETGTEQIFTNGETSIFCLKPNTIDFSILENDNLVSLYNRVSRDEIQKYFNISKQLLGDYTVDVSFISFLDNSIISFYGRSAAADSLSNLESKLIGLLFKKTDIKGSQKNPIIHVESDNGYAYVLGKRSGIPNKF
jgi:hypothetical protein